MTCNQDGGDGKECRRATHRNGVTPLAVGLKTPPSVKFHQLDAVPPLPFSLLVYIPARWSPALYRLLQPAYDPFAHLVSREARRRAVAALHPPADAVVLVAGCGTGLSLPLLAEVLHRGWIEAVDTAPAMLGQARRRADACRSPETGIGVRLEDISELPYPDHTFDAILSAYVLDLLPPSERRRACRALARVARPGGRLITVTPAVPRRPGDHLLPYLARLFPPLLGGGRPVDLRPLLRETGWRIKKAERSRNAGLASQIITAHRP